jgi:hypothetical protein
VTLKRLLLAVVLLAVVAGVGWAYYPPFRLFTLYAAGRKVICPFDESLAAADHVKRLKDAKDRILAGSKLVQSDPAGYQLWDTPKGRWWIPQGAEYVLPFNLAEQELDIYGTGDQAESDDGQGERFRQRYEQ